MQDTQIEDKPSFENAPIYASKRERNEMGDYFFLMLWTKSYFFGKISTYILSMAERICKAKEVFENRQQY